MGDWLVVASCNGYVRALDKRTGELRWVYDTRPDGNPFEFHGDPLVTEDLIILGSDFRRAGSRAYVYAFDKTTGKLRWKHQVSHGVMTDIVPHSASLYALTLDDELICLELATGKLKWKFATGFANPDFTRNFTPAVAGGRVFFAGLNGTLYALEADSGKLTWQHDLGARPTTAVAYRKNLLYVGTAARRLYHVDAASGKVQHAVATKATPRGPLILAGDSLFVFLGDSSLASFALDGASSQFVREADSDSLRWSAESDTDWSSSRPYLWRDMVLAGDEEGFVFAYRLSDGTRVWVRELQGTVRGIGTGEDILYVGMLGGRVYALRFPPPAP